MKALVVVESVEPGNFHRGVLNGFYAAGVETHVVIGARNGGLTRAEFEKKLLRSYSMFSPDLLYVLKGALISPEAVRMVGNSAITVNHQVDDPYEQRSGESFRLSEPYQFVFGTDVSSVGRYNKPGGIMQFGADPVFHRPMHLRRDIDVSFVGSCYAARKAFLHEIPDVQVFGSGDAMCKIKGRISHLQMIEIANRSLINLNFSDQPHGFLGLKNRLWEIMATGSFVLTQWSYNLEDWFTPGVDLEVFRDADEMREKVEYYLTHNAERERIARTGYERVMREGLWEHRVQEMIAAVLP